MKRQLYTLEYSDLILSTFQNHPLLTLELFPALGDNYARLNMLVKYMCFQRMRSARLSTEITCVGMVEPINASTSNWTDAFSFYFENLRKEYTYTTTMWCNRWASVRFFLGSCKQNPSIDSSDSMKWLKWYTSTFLCEEHRYFAIGEISRYSQIISCHLSVRVAIQESIKNSDNIELSFRFCDQADTVLQMLSTLIH